MDPAEYPTRAARLLVPSCLECTLRLGKGDAFVLLWVVNKPLRLIPRRVSFWKGLGFCLTRRQVDKALNSKLVEQS